MDIWLWLIVGFVYAVFTVAAVVAAENGFRITTFLGDDLGDDRILRTIEAIFWPVSILINVVVLALMVAYLFVAAILLTYFLLKDYIAKTLKLNAKANLQ